MYVCACIFVCMHAIFMSIYVSMYYVCNSLYPDIYAAPVLSATSEVACVCFVAVGSGDQAPLSSNSHPHRWDEGRPEGGSGSPQETGQAKTEADQSRHSRCSGQKRRSRQVHRMLSPHKGPHIIIIIICSSISIIGIIIVIIIVIVIVVFVVVVVLII